MLQARTITKSYGGNQVLDGVSFVVNAGDAMNIPPGHDAWVLGDEPVVVVDFQGFIDYAKRK